MFKLEYQYEEGDPKIVMELHRDTTLPQALVAFEQFLRAAGYSFDGTVDIVPDMTDDTEGDNQ